MITPRWNIDEKMAAGDFEESNSIVLDNALQSSGDDQDDVCNLCNSKFLNPRVLSCLHVYCEDCLDAQASLNDDPDAKVIICPGCNQQTRLGSKCSSSLPLDYVIQNLIDMAAIKSSKVLCTSCKAKVKAVARCSDCANYLCPNCNSAHQYMRCFDNHRVVHFDELLKSSEKVPIHKPLGCCLHSTETLKLFCHACQVPVCIECTVTEHKLPEHHCEPIIDIEEDQKQEIKNLVSESKNKVTYCEEATETLQSTLQDLEYQKDYAKSQIEETSQALKAIIDNCCKETLRNVDEVHTKQELRILDMFNNVEKTMYKIEDACKFASRLLHHGSDLEILSLKKVVNSQLMYLINNTPILSPEADMTYEFLSDTSDFEAVTKKMFGSLKKEEKNSDLYPLSISIPSFSNTAPLTPSVLPTNYEEEGFALPAGVLSPDGNQIAPSPIPSNQDMLEYNLKQLASLAGKSESNLPSIPESSPTPPSITQPSPTSLSQMSDPSSPIILADLLNLDLNSSSQLNAINLQNNLQALAKLGCASVSNNAGQMMMNGPIVSGMSLDSMPNTTTQSVSSVRTMGSVPPSPKLPTSLSSLMNEPVMNGVLNNHTPSHTRGSSPLDGNLLNTQVASIGGNQSSYPQPRPSSNKMHSMQIRCKFGQLGPAKGQFNSPHGFCLGIEEDIIVADTNNHRIQVFDKSGDFRCQFGIPGKEEGQLWYPRKVAIMRNSGKFVVCDRGNERSRMQIFTKAGQFIKKIAIRYIDIVAGLAVTQHGHIVAVDSVSPTVFVIAESGELVKWFDCSEYMREPSDIAINGKEYFVCDFKGHCVVVFNDEGQFLRRIGCESITNYPNGIDISDAGDVLVGDSHGNRFHVAVFSRDGSLLSEFECPYVKVSRCCGLKITSEGYVVTLAKNNHHVLVLNTLYIV